MIKEEFLQLFEAVFDKTGNIKPCGRDVCAKLIRLAEQLDSSSVYIPHYFGYSDPNNPNYGYMNVSRIKTLHDRLISNK